MENLKMDFTLSISIIIVCSLSFIAGYFLRDVLYQLRDILSQNNHVFLIVFCIIPAFIMLISRIIEYKKIKNNKQIIEK